MEADIPINFIQQAELLVSLLSHIGMPEKCLRPQNCDVKLRFLARDYEPAGVDAGCYSEWLSKARRDLFLGGAKARGPAPTPIVKGFL